MSEDRRRLQIVFRKGEGARFLSHLDLMATLEFSIRRARLPVELSEGFNPRPRMSLASPLPLGYTGEQEILEITLRTAVPPVEVWERLQAAVPPGITIRSVEEAPEGVKTAASRLHSATYRVTLRTPCVELSERVTGLMARDTIDIEVDREGKLRRRDIRPLILSLQAEGTDTLVLIAGIHPDGTVRPEQVLELLELPAQGAQIVRERIELKD